VSGFGTGAISDGSIHGPPASASRPDRRSRYRRAVERTGSARSRVALSALRSVGLAVWRLGERLGIDVAGATEGPRFTTDRARRETLDALIAAARLEDGRVDTTACPFPVHEFLTHLVFEHGLLLHGSNDASLDVLEPRAAHDFGTELRAVVASDDGIWPIFYAVVARDRIEAVFTACTHLGRPPRLRRFYMFAIGADPQSPSSWAEGVVYAVPRTGFRREWGHEWVNPEPARPVLRIPVGPEDFPLRDAVVGLSGPEEFRRVSHHLRAAKRERASTRVV
jgi:hypothetical protein